MEINERWREKEKNTNADINIFPYQCTGIQKILDSFKNNHGIILADEMGLGKTIQALVSLDLYLEENHQRNPNLIIVPLSVLHAWTTECQTFIPSLNVLIYYGHSELRNLSKFEGNVQVVLTTYEVVLQDQQKFVEENEFDLLIIDEAHRIKNENSLTHQITRRHTLLLTGTPIQNNLTEFGALIKFVWNENKFTVEQFIEDLQQNTDQSDIKKILDRYMLRRTKQSVGLKLPDKREVIVYHYLTKMQRQLYAGIIMKNHDVIDALLINKEIRSLSFNNIISQLRKITAHPYTINGVEPEPFEEGEHLIEASEKLQILDMLLKNMKASGHRVLLFSQFTHILDILQDYLTLRGWFYERLDGSKRAEERTESINRFNDMNGQQNEDQPFVFLLSTRAGGIGITLTSADTVIFYDSDWNPHADKQAAARCHRIGQTRPVKIYRLVAQHTIEDTILRRANSKLRLSSVILDDSDDQGALFTAKEMREMLAAGLKKIDNDDEKVTIIDDKIIGKTDCNGHWIIDTDLVETTSTDQVEDVDSLEPDVTDEDLNELKELVVNAKNEALMHSNSTNKRVMTERNNDRPLKRMRTPISYEERCKKWEAQGYYTQSVQDQFDPATYTQDESTQITGELKFKIGDVTCKSPNDAQCLILTLLDNSGEFNAKGVNRNLSTRVCDYYEASSNHRDLKLGQCHVLAGSDYTEDKHAPVALLIAQSQRNDIRMDKLADALKRLSMYLRCNFGKFKVVRAPRFGYNMPNVHWYAIERLLRKYLCYGASIDVEIYYYRKPSTTFNYTLFKDFVLHFAASIDVNVIKKYKTMVTARGATLTMNPNYNDSTKLFAIIGSEINEIPLAWIDESILNDKILSCDLYRNLS